MRRIAYDAGHEGCVLEYSGDIHSQMYSLGRRIGLFLRRIAQNRSLFAYSRSHMRKIGRRFHRVNVLGH